LETYVKEIDPKKKNLVLVNKADMLTDQQRESWANYFEEHNIHFRFFSAVLAKEKNDARMQAEFESESESESESEGDELADAT
ncbi:GTP-binding protein, partial [Aspergillus sclerotialis]